MEGLGSRIKLIRGTRSQEDFSILLDIDRSTLGSYEIDRREPDLNTLLLIAKIGGVSLDWLAGRLDNVSLEQDRNCTRNEWRDFVAFANNKELTPQKLLTLIEAALMLK